MIKRLLFVFLLIASRCAAQGTQFDRSNPLGGDIRAQSTACGIISSCVWQKLPVNATTLTVTVSNGPIGAFSATLQFEQSNDGINFVAASPASTTVPGTFSFTVTGFTDFRVRASVYASGDAAVNLQAAGPGSGGGGGGGGSSFPVTTAVTVNSGGSITTTGTGSIVSTSIPTVTSVPATCVGSQSVQLSNSTPPTYYDCVNGVYILRVTNYGWHRLGTIIAANLPADQTTITESRTIIDTNCPLLPNLLPGATCFRTWAAAGYSAGGDRYWEAPTADPFAIVISPTVTPASHAHISVSKCGSTYFLTGSNSFGTSTGIDLYSSATGNQDWVLVQANIIVRGAGGQFDSNNLANTHLACAGTLDATANNYLYYEGQDATPKWAMGVATCSTSCFSGASTWTKSGSNPLIVTTQSQGGCEFRLLNAQIVARCHGELSIPTGGTSVLPSDLFKWISSSGSPTGPFTAPTGPFLQRATFDEGVQGNVGQLNKATTLDLNGNCYLFYTASNDGSQQAGGFHVKMAMAFTTCAAMALANEQAIEPDRFQGQEWATINSSYPPPSPGLLIGNGPSTATTPAPDLFLQRISNVAGTQSSAQIANNCTAIPGAVPNLIKLAWSCGGWYFNTSASSVDSTSQSAWFMVNTVGTRQLVLQSAFDANGNAPVTIFAPYSVRNESAPSVIVATANASVETDDSVTHTPSWNNNSNGLSSPTGAWQCTNITPVTVNANVATDQLLMSCSVPAGTLNRVGRSLRIWLSGVYSTPAASTTAVVVKAKLGALTLGTWTSTALAGIQATNDQFNLTSLSTTQTAGATAAFEVHGNMTIDLGVGNTVADSIFADVNTATVSSVDITATQTLQITIAFTVASASNSATQRQLVVETIN
jgi:hypothetical protein